MDRQTQVSERTDSPKGVPKGLPTEVSEFAHDVIVLAELQGQLFVADVQECGRRGFVPGLILICGTMLGLACFPMALAALALGVVEVFETSYAIGFLIAVVGGVGLSALLCIIGWYRLKNRLAVLQRSQHEFVRNLCWIKKVLERRRITRKHHGNDNTWRIVP